MSVERAVYTTAQSSTHLEGGQPFITKSLKVRGNLSKVLENLFTKMFGIFPQFSVRLLWGPKFWVHHEKCIFFILCLIKCNQTVIPLSKDIFSNNIPVCSLNHQPLFIHSFDVNKTKKGSLPCYRETASHKVLCPEYFPKCWKWRRIINTPLQKISPYK